MKEDSIHGDVPIPMDNQAAETAQLSEGPFNLPEIVSKPPLVCGGLEAWPGDI